MLNFYERNDIMKWAVYKDDKPITKVYDFVEQAVTEAYEKGYVLYANGEQILSVDVELRSVEDGR